MASNDPPDPVLAYRVYDLPKGNPYTTTAELQEFLNAKEPGDADPPEWVAIAPYFIKQGANEGRPRGGVAISRIPRRLSPLRRS